MLKHNHGNNSYRNISAIPRTFPHCRSHDKFHRPALSPMYKLVARCNRMFAEKGVVNKMASEAGGTKEG
jgi:hypothetical protein